ncbi:hypothetical protein B0H11DRAFT_3777 [Mycena galericulata]|nr:hypothetical protein B0H11DRAFT_3777 [Mycena galericulata]
MDDQVAKFRKWFSLIPRADQSRPRTFRTIRDRITLSPVNSLRLLVEFGLIAAEKGFARGTHYRVTSAVSMYGDPDVVIQFINELRRRNRIYLEGSSRSTDVDTLDRRFHVDVVGVAVRALASAGRFDHAVQLIPDPTETDFHLTPYTYNFLVSKLQATEDPRYLPHINFVAQHKSETRFRSIGLKKMDKGMLALAVRCLANASQFDLAMALLPNLEGVEVAVMGQTLDVLLARLQDTRDARYSPYIDHVSKLRPSTELIPASTALSNTTEPPESESAGSATDITRDQPELIPASTALSTTTETPAGSAIDVEKDQYGPAVEALTKAWCLDEALSLVPDYHRTNDRHTTRIYNLLLWKLKASCNPKYQSAMQRITQLSDSTKELARQAKARRQVMEDANEAIRAQREAEANGRQAAGEAEASRKHAARRLEDFEGEDIHLSSSISSKQPQHVGSNLAAALRALKKGFRSLSNSHKPHPLTVVRFMELYLASGRTRAIPLLRNFVLKRTVGSWSYVFAEMLFHSRNRNPDLVIQTFVTHFYIVGLPRDELIIRLGVLERLPRAKPDIWSTRPHMRLYPEPVHTAVVWRALLAVTTDERALEDLYSKLLKFASRSMMESALHPGVPLLQPPPSWKTGADASAFTPFIRRICTAFGTDRGARILSDMLGVGIKPTIYQLTELAMEYSRTGHELKALMVLDQVERTLEKVDSVDGEAAGRRTHLTPRVDQVFYTAVIRGFLMSNKVATAREVERRMFKRYGYVAGKNQYLDELYKDLRTAESGNRVPGRPPPTSVVHTSTYKALLENPQGRLILDPPSETSNSAGA